MTNIKIDTTDIILMDVGSGRGKIIISDTSRQFTSSYFWGAMGSSLPDFLLRINSDYFVRNLTTARHGEFNARKTMSAIRRWLRTDCEFRWYEHMEFQKDLRYELNSIQRSCGSVNEFVSQMQYLSTSLPFWKFDHKWEREDVEEKLSYLWTEPWNFAEEDPPRENAWLADLHGKLKEQLSKDAVVAS